MVDFTSQNAGRTIEGVLDALEWQIGSGLPVTFSQVLATASFATPYSVGDVIGTGGAIELTSAAREAAAGGEFDRLWINAKTAQATEPALAVAVFNANPAESTITDNAAFVIHANDHAKWLATVPLVAWSVPGAAASAACRVSATAGDLGWKYKLPALTSLWLVPIARAAITLASATDLRLFATVLPD